MQVMHDDDNSITICTALYQSSGLFIIMSPAEGLHFSALVFIQLNDTTFGDEDYIARSQFGCITDA